jgi:hypothetical protein
LNKKTFIDKFVLYTKWNQGEWVTDGTNDKIVFSNLKMILGLKCEGWTWWCIYILLFDILNSKINIYIEQSDKRQKCNWMWGNHYYKNVCMMWSSFVLLISTKIRWL